MLITRDSEPIRLLKTPRSLSVYILNNDIHNNIDDFIFPFAP